jgi:hypothetical protein
VLISTRGALDSSIQPQATDFADKWRPIAHDKFQWLGAYEKRFMSVVLGLKLALVPSLIGGVTLVGRRWGPSVAGWLSAFPVVSAPILFFIALEQGSSFAANAAAATLSAVLAILVFGISYAWAATRFSWGISLVAGFATYLVAVICLSLWAPTLFVAAAAVFSALLVAPMLFPVLAISATTSSARANDIYLRMVAGAVLVLLVTHFSSRLGPQLSGVFAMFPVMSSVLVVFSHRHSGAGFAVSLLRPAHPTRRSRPAISGTLTRVTAHEFVSGLQEHDKSLHPDHCLAYDLVIFWNGISRIRAGLFLLCANSWWSSSQRSG